jgi:hypothetical protein
MTKKFMGRATDLGRKVAEMARRAPVLRTWIIEQWVQPQRHIGWKKVMGYRRPGGGRRRARPRPELHCQRPATGSRLNALRITVDDVAAIGLFRRRMHPEQRATHRKLARGLHSLSARIV